MEETVSMDLHTHLLEKKVKAKEYWKQALKRNLDVIAITEHAEKNPKKAFQALAKAKPKKAVLVPGAELDTSAGHFLVYGQTDELYEMEGLFQKKVPLAKVLEVVNKEKIMASIPHPWGFSLDSAAFIIGEKKLRKLVKDNPIGVETYNGMIGQLNQHIYHSTVFMKPLNLFSYLERNRVSRKIGLGRISSKMKRKMDSKSLELMQRTVKPIELGEKAAFTTAGSDAHFASRLGSGMVMFNSSHKVESAEETLKMMAEEKPFWTGPFVRETEEGVYIKIKEPLSKKEIAQGIKYATFHLAKNVSKKKVKDKFKKIWKKRKGKGTASKKE